METESSYRHYTEQELINLGFAPEYARVFLEDLMNNDFIFKGVSVGMMGLYKETDPNVEPE